jgi:hypothetical protein
LAGNSQKPRLAYGNFEPEAINLPESFKLRPVLQKRFKFHPAQQSTSQHAVTRRTLKPKLRKSLKTGCTSTTVINLNHSAHHHLEAGFSRKDSKQMRQEDIAFNGPLRFGKQQGKADHHVPINGSCRILSAAFASEASSSATLAVPRVVAHA